TQKLDALSVRFGQLALDSKVNFTGRPEAQPRWNDLRKGLAQTETAIAQREKAWAGQPPRVKRQVVAGVTLFAVLFLLAGWLLWPTSKSVGEQVAEKPPETPADKDKIPDKPVLVKQE